MFGDILAFSLCRLHGLLYLTKVKISLMFAVLFLSRSLIISIKLLLNCYFDLFSPCSFHIFQSVSLTNYVQLPIFSSPGASSTCIGHHGQSRGETKYT